MKRVGYGVSPDGDTSAATGASPAIYTQHKRRSTVEMNHYVSATLWMLFNAGWVWYWMAFPAVNVIFTHGYPQYGTPGAKFMSARYGWDWAAFYMLVVAWMIPLFMCALAIVNNGLQPISRAHQTLSILCMLVALIAFFIFTARILLRCNNRYSGGNSACNDLDRWCCVYFPSEWCPNTTPCTPDITASQLDWSTAYFQSWLFSLGCMIAASLNAKINIDFIEYGILR